MTATKRKKTLLLVLLAACCLGGFLFLRKGESPSGESTIPTDPAAPTESQPPMTLEGLLGEDYAALVTDTLIMQMENRMGKNPEVPYYPVTEHRPLTDYVVIDQQTQFELDGEGYLVIILPAGTVTDPAHGEQRFRILKIASSGENIETPVPEADWKLILVNGDNPIPQDFSVNLTQLRNGQAVDSRMYPDLQNMMDDARAAGLSPLICSSYRTEEDQEALYANKVSRLMDQGYAREEAEVEAARWVAVPGTSEHQLGLAVDIVAESYQVLDEQQEDTAEQKWLMEHAHQYGFILRYPQDKSHITGIGYEPWHYRYVGKEAAAKIYEDGICLEEYLTDLE